MFSLKGLRYVAAVGMMSFGLLVAGGAVLSGRPLLAQARGPVQRVVQGTVQNKDGNGLKGAVVYLTDTRSNSVKSSITDDSGNYRFVQLSAGTDYEVYAKLGDKTSKTRTISSFDTKNEFTINLKIE
jgi:hypothetical protein